MKKNNLLTDNTDHIKLYKTYKGILILQQQNPELDKQIKISTSDKATLTKQKVAEQSVVLKKYYDDITKMGNDYTIALMQQSGNEIGILNQKLNQELALVTGKDEKSNAVRKQIAEYYQKEITKVEKTETEKRLQIATDARAKEMADAFTMASTLFNGLNNISNQYFANELQSAEGNAEKQKKIKRDQFNMNKALSAANTVINTIRAVTEALPNFVLAGIIGAFGAVQTGLILSQPMPAFKKGGRMANSGLAIVGEEGPEIVNLPAGAQVANNKDSKEMLGGITINHYGDILASDPIEYYRKLSIMTQRYDSARI